LPLLLDRLGWLGWPLFLGWPLLGRPLLLGWPLLGWPLLLDGPPLLDGPSLG
jgi:hypothetical protein